MKLEQLQVLIEAALISVAVGLALYIVYRVFFVPADVKIAQHNLAALNRYLKEVVSNHDTIVKLTQQNFDSRLQYERLLGELSRYQRELATMRLEQFSDRTVMQYQVLDLVSTSIDENPRLSAGDKQHLTRQIAALARSASSGSQHQ